MDPVTLIVSALAAGATAALKDTAGAAVRDAYAGLKGLLRRKLGADPEADVILDGHELKPDRWSGAVADLVKSGNAASDEEIIAAAKRLLEVTDPAGAAAGKYNVKVQGNVGAIGDHAKVNMGLGGEPETKS